MEHTLSSEQLEVAENRDFTGGSDQFSGKPVLRTCDLCRSLEALSDEGTERERQ